jgi:hypothetical protein
MFEGQFVFGQTYSAVVSVIVVLVSTLFVLFGFLTMRNLPGIFQVKISRMDRRRPRCVRLHAAPWLPGRMSETFVALHANRISQTQMAAAEWK